jgi:subtilisin family serine protease
MRRFFRSKAKIPPSPPFIKGGLGGISVARKSSAAGIVILATLMLAALPSSTIIAQPQSGVSVTQGIRVIVHTAKPYKKLIDAIEDLGGTVTIQYQNVDAVAAQLPSSGLKALGALPAVTRIEKDHIVELPKSPEEHLEPRPLTVNPSQLFDPPSLAAKIGEVPDGFPSYITSVTGAADTWEENGAGAGAITAVIDTGTEAAHTCLSGRGDVGHPDSRVIEGPDLSPDAGTEFEGSTLPTNNFHGTFVAGVIASRCFIVLDRRVESDADLAAIFQAHLPEENFFTTGQLLMLPLVGLAPESSIYAVKVFPHTGSGVSSSIIESAIDHVITKKKEHTAGLPGGLDIDVINLSLGGSARFDGRTLEDQLVDAATDAGILVVAAAGNDGPAPVSVSTPGTAFSALTAGASSDPVHTRVFWDITFGPGQGHAMYPDDEIRPADFSGRGPLADGRASPDVTATGVFNLSLFPQNGTGFASGTSFSTPAVAGGAALLMAWAEANAPEFGPLVVRNAMIDGASPLSHEWKRRSQGAGYLNVAKSLELMKSGETRDELRQAVPDEDVPNVVLRDGAYSTDIRDLQPARTVDLIFEIDPSTTSVTIDFSEVSIDPNPVPAALPNSIEVYVKGAKRGGLPYLVYSANVVGPAQLTIGDGTVGISGAIFGAFIDRSTMEPGLMKVTVQGDWTNNGNVGANVTIIRNGGKTAVEANDRIRPGETILIPVDIPSGTTRAAFELGWRQNWARFPTNDLDLFLCAPGFVLHPDFSGSTLNSPEHLTVFNPAAGTWYVMVMGFGVFTPQDAYYLDVDVAAPADAPPNQPASNQVGYHQIDDSHNPDGHNEKIFRGEPCF